MALMPVVGIRVHGGCSKCPSEGDDGEQISLLGDPSNGGKRPCGTKPQTRSHKDFQGHSKDPRPLVRSPAALPSLVCFSLDLEGTRRGPE